MASGNRSGASDAKAAPPASNAAAAAAESGQPGARDPASLEEDDEFEDFPVDDWPAEETEMAGNSVHLWEESWDDDDTSEDFSKQLKEELDKVKAGK